MGLTEEVNWTVSDFVIAAALVGGMGLALELAVRVSGSRAYRAGAALALGGAFLLVWINGAVGIIGSEDEPVNLLFFGVPMVALVGAALARFRPRGMARAMMATAAAQVLVFVVVLVAGLGFAGPITVFFAALWLASAWLFETVARQREPEGRGAL
jgi:hypothetical protein